MAELTLSDLATIYGCCGLFDMCSDQDVLSLHFSGAEPFMDWIGWQPTLDCVVKREFIAWVKADESEGDCTPGWVTDPCADANGVDWGKCDFTLEDFGRLGRQGPVRDVTMNDVRYCARQPRYRLDGTLVTDDREYDMRVIGEVIMQDLRNQVIIGNAGTAGQFDGLQRLVRTGYTNANGQLCAMMDSTVVDWNGNGMNGGNGITMNGVAIANTWTLVDVLRFVYRRIRQRIKWSPVLGTSAMREGDMVLVLPDFLAECLLNAYTCWSVCAGSQYNEVALQSFEARTFRNNLAGGMFGAGTISFDGFRIPLIAYDWSMINNGHTGDMYLLVGGVGSVKTLMGEYDDMRPIPAKFGTDRYFYTDGGRILGWVDNDNACVRTTLQMRPRLVAWAPWTLARFQDVACALPGSPISPDPCSPYFPETTFYGAECP